MNLNDLIEKLKRYPVPVVSGAMLIGCFLAFYFRMDMISALELRQEEANSQANQVADNAVAGTSLDDHVESMRVLSAELDRRVVRQSELAVNLKYFYGFEAETGVSLSDLRQNVAAAKGPGQTVYSGVGYNLILSGSFDQIIAYFDELENGERFYRLNNFNLQRGREAGQSSIMLALNLELLGLP